MRHLLVFRIFSNREQLNVHGLFIIYYLHLTSPFTEAILFTIFFQQIKFESENASTIAIIKVRHTNPSLCNVLFRIRPVLFVCFCGTAVCLCSLSGNGLMMQYKTPSFD